MHAATLVPAGGGGIVGTPRDLGAAPRAVYGCVVKALLEREAELERLGAALDTARAGRGATLLVQGSAGIGKTSVLEAAAASARRQGMTVLRAAGGELEREFAYGVVRQLFDPVLRAERDPGELLEGAAQLALPALSFVPTDAVAPSEPAILHGLYWLTAAVAARGPTVLAVDDAQWADVPSLRFAVYLARRIADLPVVLLLAARDAEPGTPEALSLVVMDDPPVAPGPLSEAAVGEIAAATLGAVVEPAFAAAVRAASGGNPFLTAELIRAASAAGVAPTAAGAARLHGLATEGVDRSVRQRLSHLEDAAVALARAVAVLGDESELRHAAALAGLDEVAAAAAADQLAAADILEPRTPLAFCHALVRTSVAGALSAGERDLLHARAARALHAGGASADRVSAQLLVSAPAADAWVVSVLREAAFAANAQGSPETAATLLRRALAEPPPAEERAQLLLALGTAEAHGDVEASAEHLRAAADALTDPAGRAVVVLALAHSLVTLMRPREAIDVLVDALDAVEAVDRELALELAAQLAVAERLDLAGSAGARERIDRLAHGCSGASRGERALLVAVADRQIGTARSAARRRALRSLCSRARTTMGTCARSRRSGRPRSTSCSPTVSMRSRRGSPRRSSRPAGPDRSVGTCSPSACGATPGSSMGRSPPRKRTSAARSRPDATSDTRSHPRSAG